MSDIPENNDPEEDALKTFVTDLRPVTEQVGAHVLNALQDDPRYMLMPGSHLE